MAGDDSVFEEGVSVVGLERGVGRFWDVYGDEMFACGEGVV